MENLFDDKHNCTDEANAIHTATADACRDIMNTWSDLGYSPREICYIMMQTINDLSLDKLLDI